MNVNLKHSIKVALLGGGVVLAGACTKDFDKINVPPNSAVKVNPDYVVSNVQRNASFDKIDLVPGVLMFGNWVQHWGNQNAGFTTAHYLAIPNYDDGLWGNHYAYLKDLNMAETDLLAGQEEAPEGRSKVAEIRIMKAMIAERLTALVGDIPYTEAVSTPGKITAQPQFDTQESIYPQLITSLDEAKARITPGDVTFGNADFYFNGDPEKWKKFANALKLRTAMRMKYANPGAAQAAVTAAMGQPLPASLADAAFVATDAANRNTGHRIWQRSDLDKT
ncbi:MAG: SusD/RagB family nutrient-binding outer membrane lipoprotein, partial [Cytophagales bacterium]|nr:SusD/RagB family nutrient-binding outer membrane lipoprotein [Cytophagales bacterium]